MGSTSDHEVGSRLTVANPVAPWSLECQPKQEHGQSGCSVHGVWLICPEHVCTQNCGDHVRQSESHSGSDAGRTEAIQVSDRHRFSPRRHQASGHKMLSARRTANLHCEAMRQPKMMHIIIIFFTSFPGCETLSKVCGVWNGYNGDSEIVKVLDRQTALKCWIAMEICWYRNVISQGSAVLRDPLLPISEINSCASSAKTPRVSTATG